MIILTLSQTLFHWLSIIVSVLLYFVFALIYNGACVDCLDLNNIPFWVMQHSMGTIQGHSSIGKILALHYLYKSVNIQLGFCNIPSTTHISLWTHCIRFELSQVKELPSTVVISFFNLKNVTY